MRHLFYIVTLFIFLTCSSSKNDSDKQRFLIRGNDALSRSEYKDALRYFNGAIALDSCYVNALNNIGIVYFESNKYSEAIQSYDAAILCQPTYWDAYLNRASA
ncbi:MAG: tetratricopeptide repeat protein, partial [Cyclobacteriaceae bacterium]|nr:tetratricopeptide repeat protein [Cyclobacteriaceae bacterium]